MKEKSSILKDMALGFERHENVNEMIGILVYEYTVADNSYYLCSNFEDIFSIDTKQLNDEWSVINMLDIFEGDRDIFNKFIDNVKNSPLVQKVTVRIRNRYNVYVWYTVTIQALRGLENEVVRYLCTFQNVDVEMKIKGEMAYRADYDSLTKEQTLNLPFSLLILINSDSLTTATELKQVTSFCTLSVRYLRK